MASRKFRNIDPKQVKRNDLISAGSFGMVYRGILPEYNGVCAHGPMVVAVKMLNKNIGELRISEQESLMREIETMKKLSHPSIVKLIGYSYNDRDAPIIVTELCRKSLEHVLEKESFGTPLSWTRDDGTKVQWNNTKKNICAIGVAIGLCHIHDKRIIHRDVKPGNILLDDNMYPKISDFGLSRFLPHGIDGNKDLVEMEIQMGAPLYMAPEVFNEELGGYNLKADVYSYGIMLYELMTGEKPYIRDIPELTRDKLFHHVSRGIRPKIPEHVNPAWANLMKQCWDGDVHSRPTMKEVVSRIIGNDDFILDGCDLSEYKAYIEMAVKCLEEAGCSLDEAIE